MGSLQQGDEEILLLENEYPQYASKGIYVGDGTVDLNGHPAARHLTGNWNACIFILGTECCERLAYYGIAKNLVTYLTTNMHLGNISAARSVTAWQGTCYLTPLIGAFFADAYWGRFWTIAAFSIIYSIGMTSLTLSASIPVLKPPQCFGTICSEPSTPQYFIFFFSLYLIALGSGGIKPCVPSFGADQFDDTDPSERIRKSSFFTWYYFAINCGSFVSGSLLVWIQDNQGWALGFGIPSVFMALAVCSFFLGVKLYRFQNPGGSPIVRIFQVFVASFRKWNLDMPDENSILYELRGDMSAVVGSRKLEHTSQYRFLDKAAIVTTTDTTDQNFSNPWKLCTVTQIEELKLLIRIFPIWASSIIFSTVYSQNSSMFIEQGMALDRKIGSFSIPAASISTFDVISVLFCLSIYDRLLIPAVRKFTRREKGFSDFQRIGIGLILSILAMISASLVEIKRLRMVKCGSSLSIMWQIPQYFLVGAAEAFTLVGLLEFFYEQAPDAMRSLCSAFFLLTNAFGSYFSALILSVVNYVTTRGGGPGWIPDNLDEGRLDLFFLLIAGLSFLNFLVFTWSGINYKSKKTS